MSAGFRDRPWTTGRAAAPPPHASATLWVSAEELAELRQTIARLSRRFIVANAATFAVMVLLACTATRLLGTEIVGNLSLGMLLALAQGVLLLATAGQFDRRSTQLVDGAVERLSGIVGARRSGGQQSRRAHPDDLLPGPSSDWRGDRGPLEPVQAQQPASQQRFQRGTLPSQDQHGIRGGHHYDDGYPRVQPVDDGTERR